MSVIDELFLGNIKPVWEMPRAYGYAEALHRVAETEKALATLSEEEKKKFREYRQACEALNFIVQQERFQVGFRLGAQMMLEMTK